MTDSVAELFAAYPHVVHAISYVELILCEPDDEHPVSAWDTFVVGSALTPAQVIGFAKDGCREEIALGTRGKWAEALVQCDHPEFLTYIKGKMGMM